MSNPNLSATADVNANSNAGLSIVAIFIALALLFVFGFICSKIVQSGGGAGAGLLGAALALGAGYGAASIAKAIIPRASVAVISYGLIAIVILQYLMSEKGPYSTLGYLCAIIGSYLASKRRPTV